MKRLLMALSLLAMAAAPTLTQACGADKQASAKPSCEGDNCVAKADAPPCSGDQCAAKPAAPPVAKTVAPPCEGQNCASKQDHPKIAAANPR